MKLTKQKLENRKRNGSCPISTKQFISFSYQGKTENWKPKGRHWIRTCVH